MDYERRRLDGAGHDSLLTLHFFTLQAVALYIMHDLVDNYAKDEAVKTLVDTFEWTFVPVVNVDGFEYSRTQNRLVCILIRVDA